MVSPEKGYVGHQREHHKYHRSESQSTQQSFDVDQEVANPHQNQARSDQVICLEEIVSNHKANQKRREEE